MLTWHLKRYSRIDNPILIHEKKLLILSAKPLFQRAVWRKVLFKVNKGIHSTRFRVNFIQIPLIKSDTNRLSKEQNCHHSNKRLKHGAHFTRQLTRKRRSTKCLPSNKELWLPLVILKDHEFSHLVYPYMRITHLWKLMDYNGRRSYKRKVKETTPLLHKMCVLSDAQ